MSRTSSGTASVLLICTTIAVAQPAGVPRKDEPARNGRDPLVWLLENDVKTMQASLEPKELDHPWEMIRVTSEVLAVAARHRIDTKRGDRAEITALCGNALKLADAAGTSNMDAAQNAFRDLATKSKVAKVPDVSKLMALDTLHTALASKRRHGWGSELDLLRIAADKRLLSQAQRSLLEAHAYRIAIVAEATEAVLLQPSLQKGVPDNRLGWAREMNAAARDLAAAAPKENEATVRAALTAVNRSCSVCHQLGILPPPPNRNGS